MWNHLIVLSRPYPCEQSVDCSGQRPSVGLQIIGALASSVDVLLCETMVSYEQALTAVTAGDESYKYAHPYLSIYTRKFLTVGAPGQLMLVSLETNMGNPHV